MASLIPGYEYDIFISYRQKDNKYDGWVTEFVDNLRKELEATFKEQVSVYFDINPSDYLLESYDVDASLKDKLKCLVFIPIISRTYCDSKSFAWVHEFRAFVEQASKDQYGLKVKLPNGNVANRVLPVRIHDLDISDVRECESVLGGVLRGIEFIYKEAGIDKPLSPDDDEKKNLNNTKYRIQIIKVAHAIKEIILGMKTEPILEVKEKDQAKEPFKEVREDERKIDLEKPVKSGKWKLLSAVTIGAILIIAGIIAYPKIVKRNTLEKLRSSGERISIAVMPFQNMTGDTSLNYQSELFQNNLINLLSYFPEELIVRQTETTNTLIQNKGLTNYASITLPFASAISKKLKVDIFIYGNIQKIGNIFRVNAQLIDTKTDEILKPLQIEISSPNLSFSIIDSLSMMAKNFLVISNLKNKELPVDYFKYMSSDSPEAFRDFVYAEKAFSRFDYATARIYLLQVIEKDSNFLWPYMQLAYAYGNAGLYNEAKKWCLRFYEKRNKLPEYFRILADYSYATYFETPNEEVKYARQIIAIDDQGSLMYWQLGTSYSKLQQYDKAIPAYEKSLELIKKWGTKPVWVLIYTSPGRAYHERGQYRKEKKLYKKAEYEFPDDPTLIRRQAILALSVGKMDKADEYIEKYKSNLKENSATEASISGNLAGIYSEAEIFDKAEEYYRKALSLEPKVIWRMNQLAYFLINKDRNVNEGVQLADSVLKLRPDDFNYQHTKGWGLYKQSKYQESLTFLQKSWDLRMKNAIYNHEAFLHLEAARKAVAGQKSN